MLLPIPRGVRLAIAAILYVSASMPALAGATIALRTVATTSGATVTVGDIAHVSGASKEELQRLSRVPLGRIGSGGAPVVIERARIAHWVCVKTGRCGSELAWSGAEAVEVRSAMREVSRDALVASARQALERALAPLDAELRIGQAAGQRPVKLPPGRLSYSARALPAGTVPGKRMLVWVDVLADGRFVRAVPVQFEVAALAPGWVARVPLAAGTRVTADLFDEGQVDLATATAGAAFRRRGDTFVAAGEAWVVRKDLRRGQALTLKNSSPAPLVARGELATLRMTSVPIEMESRVEVLQDGFLGQTVKVKAMQATGVVLATVAGPGLVEMQN